MNCGRGRDLERARARQIDREDPLQAARARRHHHDPIGEEHRLGDVVGDEHDGLSRLQPDLLEQQVHLVAGEGIERPERLVHQEQGRVERERADDRGALLHAARELARILGLEALEADPAQEALDPLLVRGRLQALDLERQMDVLDQRAPGQQIGVLEHHADLRVRPGDRRAVQEHAARGQLVQAGHRPEQRGFAAARRPEHADQLALGHGHRVVFERVHQPGPGRVALGRALDHQLGRAVRAVAAVPHLRLTVPRPWSAPLPALAAPSPKPGTASRACPALMGVPRPPSRRPCHPPDSAPWLSQIAGSAEVRQALQSRRLAAIITG